MGNKTFFWARYRFLQRAAAHLRGKLGRTVEEGVKTQVSEREGKRDSQWVNFHLWSGRRVRKRWGKNQREKKKGRAGMCAWNFCRLGRNTKLRYELIIWSLLGNDLFPLDYHVVVKLSENNHPHCSPEWKTVYQILIRSQHLLHK